MAGFSSCKIIELLAITFQDCPNCKKKVTKQAIEAYLSGKLPNENAQENANNENNNNQNDDNQENNIQIEADQQRQAEPEEEKEINLDGDHLQQQNLRIDENGDGLQNDNGKIESLGDVGENDVVLEFPTTGVHNNRTNLNTNLRTLSDVNRQPQIQQIQVLNMLESSISYVKSNNFFRI